MQKNSDTVDCQHGPSWNCQHIKDHHYKHHHPFKYLTMWPLTVSCNLFCGLPMTALQRMLTFCSLTLPTLLTIPQPVGSAIWTNVTIWKMFKASKLFSSYLWLKCTQVIALINVNIISDWSLSLCFLKCPRFTSKSWKLTQFLANKYTEV